MLCLYSGSLVEASSLDVLKWLLDCVASVSFSILSVSATNYFVLYFHMHLLCSLRFMMCVYVYDRFMASVISRLLDSFCPVVLLHYSFMHAFID